MDKAKPLNIWGPTREYSFVRKEFKLSRKPATAFLRVFSDTGYELHLNGRFVATVDECGNHRDYEVKAFLVEGVNTVAAKLINHGGHRGFAFELRADSKTALVSDGSWKASGEEKWGWKKAGFNDSKWLPAHVLDLSQSGDAQWQGHPGDGRFGIVPTLTGSIFFKGAVPKDFDSPFYTANPKDKLQKAPAELAKLLGKEYQASIDLFPGPVAKMAKALELEQGNGKLEAANGCFKALAPKEFEGPSFIADFGGETVGFLRLKTKCEGNIHLRISYSENLSGCHHRPPKNQLLRRMVYEEVEIAAGEQEWESSSRQGFRYAKIEFHDCAKTAGLSEISVGTSIYPTPYAGFFSCSDALLNKIWENGRRTLHLCMQELYLDAIKRDRLLWVGDTWMHALINYYAFGDTKLFEYSWRKLAESQYADGAIPSVYGEGQPVLWDYVAWWIMALDDYRLHTGGRAFLKEMKTPLLKAIHYLLARTGKDGLIDVPENKTEGWFVILSQKTGKDALMNHLLLKSLEGVASILKFLGDAKGAAKYAKLSAKTAKALGDFAFTDEKRGAALDSFYFVDTFFKKGQTDTALDVLRKRWGGMTACGADTFFEGPEVSPSRIDEDLPGKNYYGGSHCHGWTASPTYMLQAEVLGVKPLSEGFKTFEVKPQLGSLSYAKGAIPTPYGIIGLSCEKSSGKTKCSLLVPSGCKAKVDGGKILGAGKHRFEIA